MIVDSAINFGLTQGVDRRIPQQGDAQVDVPPTIVPIVLSLQQHRTNPGAVLAMEQSFLLNSTVFRNNQAAVSTTICILRLGLWELELNMGSSYNYSGAFGAVSGTALQLIYQGTTIKILSRFAAPGSHQDYNRMRVLLVENANLQHRSEITGVAENSDSTIMINAIRIL